MVKRIQFKKLLKNRIKVKKQVSRYAYSNISLYCLARLVKCKKARQCLSRGIKVWLINFNKL